LIVNELVTNAIKHAFPDGRHGTVTVMLKKSERFELVVEDDGVGFVARKENSGSRLTRLLARQLGADIAWENAERGCRVRVAVLA
jgi:two-component sensor histidine kinase